MSKAETSCPECLFPMKWHCAKCDAAPCAVCKREPDQKLVWSEVEVCRGCYEFARERVKYLEERILAIEAEKMSYAKELARISDEMDLPPTVGPAPGEIRRMNEAWERGAEVDQALLEVLNNARGSIVDKDILDKARRLFPDLPEEEPSFLSEGIGESLLPPSTPKWLPGQEYVVAIGPKNDCAYVRDADIYISKSKKEYTEWRMTTYQPRAHRFFRKDALLTRLGLILTGNPDARKIKIVPAKKKKKAKTMTLEEWLEG